MPTSLFLMAVIGSLIVMMPIVGLIVYVGVLDWRERKVTRALNDKLGNVVRIKQDDAA